MLWPSWQVRCFSIWKTTLPCGSAFAALMKFPPSALPDPHGTTRYRGCPPMVDAFQLGERNLRDIWSLILPPVTLLELKKLSRLSPEEFHHGG